MIEKPKRPKKIQNQDNKQLQSIQELIRRYDLDNTKIYDFLDELVDYLKLEHTNIETKLEEETLEKYSTDEQEIGKWIDGKSIYRKVISFTTGASTNTWTTIAELQFNRVINLYGYMYISESEMYRLPYAGIGTNGANENVYFYVSSQQGLIREKHNYDYANSKNSYLIVEYTK